MHYVNNFCQQLLHVRRGGLNHHNLKSLRCAPQHGVLKMVAVVYRHPKPNKNFIDDFAAFLGDFIQNYDIFLILKYINIHVCCSSNSLADDFLTLVNSFGIDQQVKGSTHILGRTLDLVLSYLSAILIFYMLVLWISNGKLVLGSLFHSH